MVSIRTNKYYPLVRDFAGYSVFGTISFIADLILLLILLALGVHYLLAIPLAFFVTTSAHYVMVRRWVFKHKESPYETYHKFIMIMVGGATLVAGGVYVLVEFVAVPILVARVLVAIMVGMISFTGHKVFTFK